MKYPTGTKHLALSEVRAYARARAAVKPAAIAYCPAYFKLLPRARGLGKVFALFDGRSFRQVLAPFGFGIALPSFFGGRNFRQEHVLLCAECACRRACFLFSPQAAQAPRRLLAPCVKPPSYPCMPCTAWPTVCHRGPAAQRRGVKRFRQAFFKRPRSLFFYNPIGVQKFCHSCKISADGTSSRRGSAASQ